MFLRKPGLPIYFGNCYVTSPKYSFSTSSHRNLLIFNNFQISKQWSIGTCTILSPYVILCANLTIGNIQKF